MRARKGRREKWIGNRASPQYHEMSVKTRTEAGNAAGNAKPPNVRLREG
jgi:hypothetical protein